LLLVILFIELFGFNRNSLSSIIGYASKEVEIRQGSLNGFLLDGDQLISNNDDPKVVFTDIDVPVTSILINCEDDIPGSSQSQIFYRGSNQNFTEIRSIRFALESVDPVYFPIPTDVDVLRLDLVGQSDVGVTCENIVINPKVPFEISWSRTIVYFLLLILILLWFTYVPKPFQKKVSLLLYKYGHWLLCLALIVIGSLYKITITYDSAHYLWLADLIKSGEWASWDVIRNPGFPLQLYFSQLLFGNSIDGLRWATVLLNVLFYLIVSELAIEALQLKNLHDRYILRIIVFLFLALDPIVFGYFHSLLTEFDAAILVALSSWLSIKLLKEEIYSTKFWLLLGFFTILIVMAWFLKQPYVSSVIFPLAISLLLILFSKFSWKKLFYFSGIGLASILIMLAGQLLWTKFLVSEGNAIAEERQFSTWLSNSIENQQTEIEESSFIKTLAKKYLISINFYPYLGKGTQTETQDISLVHGYQNVVIAQRTFNIGLSTHFTTNSFSQGVAFPEEVYDQPLWLNRLFQSRTTLSNFLFTVTGLLLPFACILCFINWIRNKNHLNSVLLILLGSSALNALAHNISGAGAIDRYLFLGYPLHLISIIVIIYHVIKKTKSGSCEPVQAD
jgi:hypothetical protein